MSFPVKQRMASSVAAPTNINNSKYLDALNSKYLLHRNHHEAAVAVGRSLLGRPMPTIIDNNSSRTNSMSSGLDMLCIAAVTKRVTSQVDFTNSFSFKRHYTSYPTHHNLLQYQ